MHNEPRQQLCKLIAQYGRSLSEDPRRCRALLKDYCGQYKREIFVLVNALENRVATELLNASAGVPQVILLSRLSKRLEDEMGLAEDAAKWAVETWALALGVIDQPLPAHPPVYQQAQPQLQPAIQTVSPSPTNSSGSWPAAYKKSLSFFNANLDFELRQNSLFISATDPKKWQKAPCFISLGQREINEFIHLIEQCEQAAKQGSTSICNIIGSIESGCGKLDFRVMDNNLDHEFCIHFSDPSDRRKSGFFLFFDDKNKQDLKQILEKFK